MKTLRRAVLAAAALAMAGLSFAQTITVPGQSTPVSLSWLYYNKMRWAGAWSSTAAYNPQDVVTYGGFGWVSLSGSNLNQTPVAGIWWAALPIGAFSLPSGTQTQYLQIQPNAGNNSTYRFVSPPAVVNPDYNYGPQTCNASNSCSVGGSNGAVLVNGVASTITANPCPNGIVSGAVWSPIELSGGVGTAEAVTPSSGTCTSGAASGTIVFTPAQGHSGAWTFGPASAGLQEAICALPASGGSVTIPATSSGLTLLASVTSCGKNDVVVTKQPGAVISGSFNILNLSTVTHGYEQFWQGIAGSIAVPFLGGASDAPVVLGATDVALNIGRHLTGNYAQGYPTAALQVAHTYDGTTGTPWGMAVLLNLNNLTSSLGSAGIATYVFKQVGSTDESIGVHGECDIAGNGSCLGLNAEGSVYASGTTTPTLFGLVSNMNFSGFGHPTIYGLNVLMNGTQNGANSGFGAWIHAAAAGAGTVHAAGLRIEEDSGGGSFTNMAVLVSRLSTNNAAVMYNGNSSTNTGFPNQLIFGRGVTLGVNQVGMIQSDAIADANFGEGYVDIYTAHSAALNKVVRFDNFANVLLFGHLGQNTGNHDIGGTITLSGVTSAAFTFGTAYAFQPVCTVSPQGNVGAVQWWVTPAVGSLTVTASSAVTTIFEFLCVGNPN